MMVLNQSEKKLESMEPYENEKQILHSYHVSFIRRSILCGCGHADFLQRAGAESVYVGARRRQQHL